MGRKYQVYIHLLDSSSPLEVDSTRSESARICDALNDLFDLVRRERSTLVHYAGAAHDVFLLPEEAIKRAEEREEQELARALLDAPAGATACGAPPESQPQGKVGSLPTARSTPQSR